MARSELRTLGTLDLRIDGNPSMEVLARSKHVALLAYMAAARPDGSHRRETLMALFWPESDESHARRSLRQAVYELRRDLGADAIHGHDAGLIGIGDLWCDAHEFQTHIEGGDRERAVDLFRGEFLPGFHLNEDAEEFQSWLAATRTRMRKAAVGAARTLTEDALGAGDKAGARRWAEKTLELAPYDEEALRRLLGILEQAGNRPRAIQEFRRFADRLERDLQMHPGPETAAMVRRLQEAGE